MSARGIYKMCNEQYSSGYKVFLNVRFECYVSLFHSRYFVTTVIV